MHTSRQVRAHRLWASRYSAGSRLPDFCTEPLPVAAHLTLQLQADVCGDDTKVMASRFPRLSVIPTTHVTFFPPKREERYRFVFFLRLLLKLVAPPMAHATVWP